MPACNSCGVNGEGPYCPNCGTPFPLERHEYQQPGQNQYQQPYQQYQPQPYSSQPYPPPYAYPPPPGFMPQDNSLGMIALIFGILALLATLSLFGGIILGIIAVVTGHMARKRGQQYGNAGFLMGIIAIILGFVIIVVIIIAGSLAGW